MFCNILPVNDPSALIDEVEQVAARVRPHYRRFLEPLGGQILLTGHSHQAWPEASRLGQLAAWDEAAQLCDEKWGRVLGEVLDDFQRHVAKRIGTVRSQDLRDRVEHPRARLSLVNLLRSQELHRQHRR